MGERSWVRGEAGGAAEVTLPRGTLAELIQQRRAQHGLRVGRSQAPFDFDEWLRGVRDGLSVESPPRTLPLL